MESHRQFKKKKKKGALRLGVECARMMQNSRDNPNLAQLDPTNFFFPTGFTSQPREHKF